MLRAWHSSSAPCTTFVPRHTGCYSFKSVRMVMCVMLWAMRFRLSRQFPTVAKYNCMYLTSSGIQACRRHV